MTINKNAPINKSDKDAGKETKHSLGKTSNFSRITNQAELWALSALVEAGGVGISRKELDRACGASNSPEIVRRLRAKDVVIHCEMRKTRNRFGESVQAGYYTLLGFGSGDKQRLGQEIAKTLNDYGRNSISGFFDEGNRAANPRPTAVNQREITKWLCGRESCKGGGNA